MNISYHLISPLRRFISQVRDIKILNSVEQRIHTRRNDTTSPKFKGKLDIERSSVCGKDEMWDAKSLCAFSSYLKRNCPVRCQTCTTLNSTSDASPKLSVLPMEYWALESGPDASSDIREYEVAWSKMERLYDEATARVQLHAAVVFYPNEANREASVLLHVYKRFLTLRTQLLGKGWTNILMASNTIDY